MRKGERRKAEILDAAQLLFSQKGYRRTTLQDILDLVGCSKGSFYHHFESKLQVLEAIALARTREDYESYRAEPREHLLDALNDLLYFSCPFRRGEERFLAAVIGLGIRQEGAVISAHLRQARRSVFFDDLVALLIALREEGIAHYHHETLPELLWDAHMAFCEGLMHEGCRLIISGATPAGRMAQMLRTARFFWERLLDLPFASLSIVPLEEMMSSLSEASAIVKAEEEQLRFDTAPAG